MKKNPTQTYINNTGIFWTAIFCNVAANGKAWIAEPLAIFNIVAPGHRHVVHNPVNYILTLHHLSKYMASCK